MSDRTCRIDWVRIVFIACVLVGSRAATASSHSVTLDSTRTNVVIDVLPDAPETIDIQGDGIVNIRWSRGGRSRGVVPIILLPAARDGPVEVTIGAQSWRLEPQTPLLRVRVDPAAYASLTAWDQTPRRHQRVTVLLIAVAFAATVLLAMLWPRRTLLLVVGVCVIWTVGLSIWLSRRPTLLQRDGMSGPTNATWFLALRPQKLRFPISAGKNWLPVIESARHLRDLDPTVLVHGEAASIEVSLGTRAKVGFTTP